MLIYINIRFAFSEVEYLEGVGGWRGATGNRFRLSPHFGLGRPASHRREERWRPNPEFGEPRGLIDRGEGSGNPRTL